MFEDDCKKLVTRARNYERHPREQYVAQKPSDTDIWYEVAHAHFLDTLVPALKQNGEMFVDYWPVWFIADRENALQKGLISGDFHDFEYGTYGTGYVCLTNRNLHIVAIDALTKRFPLNKASFTGFLADMLSKRINSTRPFKGDRIWTLAPSSIAGVGLSSDRRGDERIKLVTATETWELFEHFIDHRTDIFGGIECLRGGQFADLRPKWHVTKRPPILSQAELDQYLRNRPRTTLTPAPVDPAHAAEGAKMLDLHCLADQVIQRGGAAVELDLAHAAASQRSNQPLQELRWAFANMRHLLDRCQTVDEALDTIHLRIDRISGLAEQYRTSIAKLSRPHFKSLHALPDKPHPALIRTISIGKLHNPEDYSDDYMPVTWGPQGNTLLTSGNDGWVRIWSLVTSTVVDQFQAFEKKDRISHWIDRLVLSPDGKILLTVSLGQGIKAWNTEDWSLRFFVDGDNQIFYCAFDLSGTRVAYRRYDSYAITILDASTGRPVRHEVNFEALKQPGDTLSSSVLAPSGDWVLVQIEGEDGYCRLVAVETSSGKELFSVRDYYSARFVASPRGDRIYSSNGQRRNLYVWDIAANEWGPEIARQDSQGPWSLSPLGRSLVCGYSDGTIVIHDALSGAEQLRFVGHSGPIRDCTFSPDERYLLSKHENHGLNIWDLTKASRYFEAPKYFFSGNAKLGNFSGKDDDFKIDRACNVCAVIPTDDTAVFVVGSEGDAAILDSASGRNSKRFLDLSGWRWLAPMSDYRLTQIHLVGVRRCAVSANGESVLLVNNGEWAVFDTRRFDAIHSGEIDDSFLRLNCCALSPDCQWMAIGIDNKLMIRNLIAGQAETVSMSTRAQVRSCLFDPKNQWIAWANGDYPNSSDELGFQVRELMSGSLRSFDVQQLVQSKTSGYTYSSSALTEWGFINDLAMTPDGSLVLAAHSRGTISAWDAASLKLVNSWPAHRTGFPAQIACAAMPDNRTVLTIAHDGAVKLYEIKTGECLLSAFTDDELADCDVFPDGKRVVAVGKAGVHWLEIVG